MDEHPLAGDAIPLAGAKPMVRDRGNQISIPVPCVYLCVDLEF